jgi:endonuclease G, mitochondrial
MDAMDTMGTNKDPRVDPPPLGEPSPREAAGFDAQFLGVDAAMPRLPEDQAAASVELAYQHFTVVLDTDRRFAGVTGVNIDGAQLMKVPREDRWEFDERIPAELQAGPEIYADNDLDRGHLVRRNDPVWGSPDVAARANTDTFRFTNAAPQASGFNQSRELWLGLEDHVLEHARVHDLKLSVFTGPVLAADDPPYRGIRIPLKFWKIAAWNDGTGLATTGFVVDQSPLVDTENLPRAVGAPPPLGPFRTFQVRVADIAELTGLAMPELVHAEHLPRGIEGWRPIVSLDDVLV